MEEQYNIIITVTKKSGDVVLTYECKKFNREQESELLSILICKSNPIEEQYNIIITVTKKAGDVVLMYKSEKFTKQQERKLFTFICNELA